MNLAVARQLAFVLVSLCAGTGACHALTVAELERLLQSAAATQAVPFHEVRESSWMSAPVESRGTLRSSAGRLEKRVESPRQETWLILEDRMEWIGPNAESKQIMFSGAPAVAALAQALRSAVAGELVALEKSFRIEIRGDERQWTAQLVPRAPEVVRSLDQIELRGAGSQLQVIVVAEREGERTTTRLRPKP
jgi:hypothetical protein